MSTATTVQRDWIATEFSKGISAEQDLIDEAKARAGSPPDPALQVLYNEIASADERHRGVVETIATRYGHTPRHSVAGGIGETLGRLKDKVGEIGSTPLQRVSHDLAAKANAIHWYTAWIAAFEAIGDAESARELGTVLAEEKSHRDALQEGLNRMVTQGASGEVAHGKS
jgi:rubrerythrin